MVSGQSASGLIHYTSIVASDPKSASVHTVRHAIAQESANDILTT